MVKKDDKPAAKPLPAIRATENPFGDFDPEHMAGKPLVDRFYLKGYSDRRHARDLAVKAGEKPETLAHRFQYVPVQRVDGKENKSQYVEWVAKGYRAVKYDELESLGIDPTGSTAERGADGNAIVGSQLLMVTDAQTAARRFREQRDLPKSSTKTCMCSLTKRPTNTMQSLAATRKLARRRSMKRT